MLLRLGALVQFAGSCAAERLHLTLDFADGVQVSTCVDHGNCSSSSGWWGRNVPIGEAMARRLVLVHTPKTAGNTWTNTRHQ